MSPEGPEREVRPLACPRCARKYGLDERFCSECGMPLVYVGRTDEQPITESHERARKIKPQYTGGRAVRVAGAANIAEAEMMQGMLLEEGIPSYQRRSRGFDVPDFLAAGPRDILVPEAGADAARDVLAQAPIEADIAGEAPRAEGTRPLVLLAAIVGGMGGAFALAWLLYQLAT
jgi:hypothetical protein